MAWKDFLCQRAALWIEIVFFCADPSSYFTLSVLLVVLVSTQLPVKQSSLLDPGGIKLITVALLFLSLHALLQTLDEISFVLNAFIRGKEEGHFMNKYLERKRTNFCSLFVRTDSTCESTYFRLFSFVLLAASNIRFYRHLDMRTKEVKLPVRKGKFY